MDANQRAEFELTFLEPIKAGHVFFYDTETDEVVHMRRDIFEAARLNSEGMDLELTESEQLDAEDAWEILADGEGRYLKMPPPPRKELHEWDRKFQASGAEDRDDYFASRMIQYLSSWLDSLKVEPVKPATSDLGLRSRSRPTA